MRILIVEDEAALAAGLRFNFEQEGYQVSVAGDGPTALSLFEAGGIDLIILDLMLPGMSGYEILRTIRKTGSDVPIIVLSARSMSEDRALAFDAGTDQYLSKPFALPELLTRVRTQLERRRKRTEQAAEPKSREPYTFGAVTIDFRRYQLAVDDRTHQLTELELQLLRYFVDHEGEVLSRGEILQNVWGESPEITTRSIDNFVLRLRRMIEQDPAQPRHILSVRGTGYRFVAAPEANATPS